jgi:hypothetical protein
MRTFGIVLLCHFGILFLFFKMESPKPQKKNQNKIAVRMVTATINNKESKWIPTLPSAERVVDAKDGPQKKETIKEKNPEIQKVQGSFSKTSTPPALKKISAQKKATPHDRPRAPENVRTSSPKKEVMAPKKEANQNKLLSLMRESVSQLEKGKTNKNNFPSSFSDTPNFQLESETIVFKEANYEEGLIHYLKERLELPEKGAVRIKLILSCEGKVSQFQILSSTSNKNSLYVEKKIASLHFPHFGAYFKGESQHTFSVTLSGI